MADPTHQVLILSLPFSDKSDAVEAAISAWLADPANAQYFEAGEEVRWSGTLTIMVEGRNKYGQRIRMVPSWAVPLAGKFHA